MKRTKYQILRNVQRVIYQAQIFRYDTRVAPIFRMHNRPDERARLFMKYLKDQIFMKCTMSQTRVSGQIFKHYQCGLGIQKCTKGLISELDIHEMYKGHILSNLRRVKYQGQIFWYGTNSGLNIHKCTKAKITEPDIHKMYKKEQIFVKCTKRQH
jgi:hypothetical protein